MDNISNPKVNRGGRANPNDGTHRLLNHKSSSFFFCDHRFLRCFFFGDHWNFRGKNMFIRVKKERLTCLCCCQLVTSLEQDQNGGVLGLPQSSVNAVHRSTPQFHFCMPDHVILPIKGKMPSRKFQAILAMQDKQTQEIKRRERRH